MLKYLNRTIAIFLLLKFNSLLAFKDDITIPDHFVNQDGIPSAIVNGVNVISGDYCEFAQDILNPGIAQLNYSRCNVSSNYCDGNICNSWENNLGGLAKVTDQKVYTAEKKSKLEFKVLHKSAYGNYSTYTRLMPKKGMPNNFTIHLDSEAYSKGLTNTGKQCISAATNPKNNFFHYNLHNKNLSIFSSDGEESIFKYNSKTQFYQNVETKKLNKHSIKYSYEKDYFFSKAIVYNSENEEISKLETHYDDKNYTIQIKGDGGASVCYNLYGCIGKLGVYWYIKDVISNRGPKISYSIEKYDHEKSDMRIRIVDKITPNNIQKIYYYNENKKINLDKFDKRLNRVRSLYILNKKNINNFVRTNYFKYACDEPGKGGTTVYYPNKAPTDYFYNKYRLTKIIQKIRNDNNSYSHYLIQQLHWLDYKNYEGNLEKKVLLTGSNEFLESTSYFYDLKGNVLEEHYRGHLTGNSTFINPNECYIKRSTYYEDRRNLLESLDDGKKKIFYSYYDNTNLIKHKFVIANNKIQLRTFYEYDKNSAVTLEIIDDGCGEDKNDLTGVTERHIKEIINRNEFPIGLPKVIYSKYLNKNNGYEEILNRREFNYTPEGWLASDETFNQNNELIAQQRYVYDSQGKIIESYDILGQGTFKQYDEIGNVIRIQTPDFNFYTKYLYNFRNQLIKEEIVQANGITLIKTYQYDDEGNKINELDIYGNVTRYTYDSINRIIQEEMPSREIKKYEYNCRNQLITKIDHYGNRTSFEYTSRNQPTYTRYPDGREERFFYDLDGTLIIKKDLDGTITENTVDYLGRVIKKVVKSESGEYLFETRKEYNAFHLLKDIDAAGNETIYEYDSAGRERKVVKGNHVKETFYDINNHISEIKTYSLNDSVGTITKYEYDLLNRITCEQNCDLLGNIQKEEYFSYDQSGNIIETISFGHAGRSISQKQFDIFGNVLLSIDPEGHKTICSIRYDFLNEQWERVAYQEVCDPLGNIIVTIKNRAGHDARIIFKDSMNNILHETINIYNQLGLLCEKIEHIYKDNNFDREVSKKIFYNHIGNIVCIVNAAGTPLQNELFIAYNQYGQKSCVKKSDGTYLDYIYYPRGLLKEFSSSDGSIHYSYEYDALDNLVKMTDLITGTSTERKFNIHKQMVLEKLSNNLEMKYTYNVIDKLDSIILPDNSYIENEYKGIFLDKIKRFDSKGELQYQHLYEDYDRKGCYNSVQLAGNAGKIEFTYDSLGRLRSTQTKHWREIIAAFDDAGNIIEREISNDFRSSKETFNYDSLYQLISEKNHIYEYDSLHNRLSKDGKLYTINELNQVTYDGDNHYNYDLCGNLIEIIGNENLKLTYDALDRLKSVEKENERYKYIYDAKNRRVSKDCYLKNSHGEWIFSFSERYLYQDQCEIGIVDSENNIVQFRVIGNGKGAEIGATIALEIENQTFAPIHDHQGNIITLLSIEDGSIFESYEYSAFGEEIIYDVNQVRKSSSVQPWHFANKRLDQETGFVYFGYRYYLPSLGKWITSDPLGDKDGPNLYAYVKNRPYALFDSFGLFGEYFDDELSYPYYHPGTYSSIAAGAGSCVELGGRHLLFPSPIRYGVEGVGLWMQGMDFHHDPKVFRGAETISVGEGNIRPGVFQLAATGILSEKINTIEFASTISEHSNNAEVFGICHYSNGGLTDLAMAGMSLVGFNLEASQYMANEINKFYSMALEMSLNPLIFIHLHSRATMEFDVAANFLSEEVRKCLVVITYGGKALKDKGYASLTNFMNPGDPLFLANPSEWLDSSNITWTNEPMKWNLIRNHYIMENGYQKAIHETVRDYYNQLSSN